MADTRQSTFALYTLNFGDEDIPVTSVRTLFADSDQNLWIGVGTYGLACREYETGKLKMYSHIPEFSGLKDLPSFSQLPSVRRVVKSGLVCIMEESTYIGKVKR